MLRDSEVAVAFEELMFLSSLWLRGASCSLLPPHPVFGPSELPPGFYCRGVVGCGGREGKENTQTTQSLEECWSRV